MAEPEGAKVVNIVTRVLNAAWVRPFRCLSNGQQFRVTRCLRSSQTRYCFTNYIV